MTTCKYCGENGNEGGVEYRIRDEIMIVGKSNYYYLYEPEAEERLMHCCDGHSYLAGLTPACKYPGTHTWVPGTTLRIGGRNADDHPFYVWLDVPLGMSASKAAKLQFPNCYCGYQGRDDELDQDPLTIEDLFPYGTENILWTGLEHLRKK